SADPPILYGRIRPMGGARPAGPSPGSDARPLRGQRQSRCWARVQGALAQGGSPPNAPWGTPSPAAPQARGVHGLRRHAKYPTVWERNDGTDIAQALSCTHNTPCFQGERGRQLWHWDNVSSPTTPVKLRGQ